MYQRHRWTLSGLRKCRGIAPPSRLYRHDLDLRMKQEDLAVTTCFDLPQISP